MLPMEKEENLNQDNTVQLKASNEDTVKLVNNLPDENQEENKTVEEKVEISL